MVARVVWLDISSVSNFHKARTETADGAYLKRHFFCSRMRLKRRRPFVSVGRLCYIQKRDHTHTRPANRCAGS